VNIVIDFLEENINKKNIKLISKGAVDQFFFLKSRILPAKKIILTFLFHNFFNCSSEISFNETHPLQRLTVAEFRLFVEYFLECGYHFISTDEIVNGKVTHQKNIQITVDDGYYSSLRILPVLEEFNIPAVFFITTNNVKENKLFWWDVLYRERSKQGVAEKKTFQEERALHLLRKEQIEVYIVKEFGKMAFYETSDLNRPMSVSELKHMARNKHVVVGNHTSDHVHLPLYSMQEIFSQIDEAQVFLENSIGIRPEAISYPYGDYNTEVVEQTRKAGLRLGVTVVPQFEFFPFDSGSDRVMQLGRYGFSGGAGFSDDFDLFRPELIPYYRMSHAVRKKVKLSSLLNL